MNTLKTLEKKNYVTDAKNVKAMAREAFLAGKTADSLPGFYFRMLIANTQVELDAEPRLRAAKKPTRIEEDKVPEHLAALEAVHSTYYEAILEAANEVFPGRGLSKERDSCTTFARTAKSTLASWIKEGNDITSVAAARATKHGFTVQRAARNVKPAAIQRRAERAAEKIIKNVSVLADMEQRRVALEAAMAKFSAELATMAGPVTRNPKVALAEHKTLEVPGVGLFHAMPPRLRIAA